MFSEMDTVNQVKILNETVCIFLILGTILSPAMIKMLDLQWLPILENLNL